MATFAALHKEATASSNARSGSSPLPDLQIPLEWIVDICDEASGWFIGTAYAYMEKVEGEGGQEQTVGYLHVVVPDESNPTWSGNVRVHYQAVRLLECCDGRSQALFNEIVRQSVKPVDWQVEWCQPTEDEEEEAYFTEGDAVYLIRLMNSLICYPIDEETSSRIEGAEAVMVSCDHNLRLLRCQSGSSHEANKYFRNCSGVFDFERLVTEGVVDWSGEAPPQELYNTPNSKKAAATSPVPAGPNMTERRERHLEKLTELYLKMRECMGQALAERERCVNQRKTMIDLLVKYVFGGDIEKGAMLLKEFEADDGEVDPTKDSMATVGKISKTLSEMSKTASEIFTTREVRKAEIRAEIERMRNKLRDAHKRERQHEAQIA